MIVEELDVTRFKVHSKAQIVAYQRSVEQVQRFDLLRRQPRNFGEGRLCTIDVVAHVATCETTVAAPEDRHLEPGRFLRRLLALATEEEWLVEDLDKVRMSAGSISL